MPREKSGCLPCGRPIPGWLESKHSSGDNRFGHLKARLDAYVKANSLNHSESRTRVLEVLAHFESHFTTTDLIKKVTEKRGRRGKSKSFGGQVGPATVYRALQFFLSAGIVRETLSTGTGETVYEAESAHHHDHIVCLECDAILEFCEPGIERLQEGVLRSLGFREARHRHVIYAHCEYRK